MDTDLARWLDVLERALDPVWEQEKLARWKQFLDFVPTDGGFRVSRRFGGADPGYWPKILVNEAIHDPRKMLLQQLAPIYASSCRRDLAVPNIRCNYGTGILPSVFGAELFWMDDALDTLPTARPLEGGAPLDAVLDAGEPLLTQGLGARVFDTVAFYMETLAPYPKIREIVWIYHPDLQGPLDVLELLCGSEMYLAFYTAPEKVRAALEIVTSAYIRFLKRWMELVPERDAACFAHWGRLLKGHVMLRNDSVVNLSPEMYADFVQSHDERILREFGGGAMHACGRIDHCVRLMAGCGGLTALNVSQPHLNDMLKVYAATVAAGKVLDCPFDADAMKGLELSRGVLLN
ncbi:MAG TPA: hypothetical protein ENN09_03045 [Planctomycetes bacterium]|nr:hypothetical protein [Planctomycetota bacterium]